MTPQDRHWKAVEEHRAILLRHFEALTSKHNPTYRKAKDIAKELNGYSAGARCIGHTIAHCCKNKFFEENGFEVEKWGYSKSTTWRIQKLGGEHEKNNQIRNR